MSPLGVRMRFAVPFGLLFAAAGPAGAQVVEWFAADAGVDLVRDIGSARLDAMGGLRIAVQDEANELNLRDYGGIQSGFLRDGDRRMWESWLRTTERKRNEISAGGASGSREVDLLETGGRISWRTERRFLSLDLSQAHLRDAIEGGESSKIRGPWWGGSAGQRLGSFTISAGLRLTSDNQDLNSADVFGIRHEGDASHTIGSIAYERGPVEIGLQGEHRATTLKGISRDESRFHEDEYTWKRPENLYSALILWRPTPRLTGGVRLHASRLDGREEGDLSWSDRMPENPGRRNFRIRTGTFEEEGRRVAVGTRWEFRPLETLQVAAAVDLNGFEDRVTEGRNFKGSRRAQDLDGSATRATGGIGASLLDRRLTIGVEGAFLNSKIEERVVTGTIETTSRAVEGRGGLEFYLSEDFVLRAGYARYALDRDLDAPRTLSIGQAYTLGAGYLPRGGLIQLDAALRMEDADPDYEGNPRSSTEGMRVCLAAKILL